jgi:hypothetical protein
MFYKKENFVSLIIFVVKTELTLMSWRLWSLFINNQSIPHSVAKAVIT